MARLARGIDNGRDGTLVDRIERDKVGLLQLREIHPRPGCCKDGDIDGVVAAFFCVASAASRSTSTAVNDPNGSCFSTVSWFIVSVPVLSLHSTSTPASSSIA